MRTMQCPVYLLTFSLHGSLTVYGPSYRTLLNNATYYAPHSTVDGHQSVLRSVLPSVRLSVPLSDSLPFARWRLRTSPFHAHSIGDSMVGYDRLQMLSVAGGISIRRSIPCLFMKLCAILNKQRRVIVKHAGSARKSTHSSQEPFTLWRANLRVTVHSLRPLSHWKLISILISIFVQISSFCKKISSANSQLSKEINLQILFRNLERVLKRF